MNAIYAKPINRIPYRPTTSPLAKEGLGEIRKHTFKLSFEDKVDLVWTYIGEGIGLAFCFFMLWLWVYIIGTEVESLPSPLRRGAITDRQVNFEKAGERSNATK